MKKPKFTAGRSGTIVREHNKGGRLPGVPPSEKQAARSRRAALSRLGFAAEANQEAASEKLERRIPGSRKVIDGYRAAIVDGDLGATDEIAAAGMSDLELVRRDLAANVKRQGSIVRETILSSSGEPAGERLRVHPGVDPMIRISESLGMTSTARRLDPKSRGEGARDEALAAHLQRDKALRGLTIAEKSKMAPPPEDDPPIIDSEIVSPAPADEPGPAGRGAGAPAKE